MKKYIKDMNVEEVTKLLSEGAILQDIFGTYEIINGLFVRKEKECWFISPCITTINTQDCYFEMPEPEIEIKLGEFYKTRNGLKAYVYSPAAENRFAVVVECKAPYTVSANGYVSDEAEDELDLIAEWGNVESKNVEDELEQLVAEGLSAKEIAQKMGFSYSHTMKLIKKNNLNYKNRSRWSK